LSEINASSSGDKFSLKLTDGILSAYLQKSPIPITKVDNFGRNLFHYCAMRGFTKSIEVFLFSMAQPDERLTLWP
jgi:hypothetical protein